MQSIANKSDFGFCKTSSFRNCINCSYRIRCINYAPVYLNNFRQFQAQEVFNTTSASMFNAEETKKAEDSSAVFEENVVLKEKIQNLENEISQLKKNTNQKQVVQSEENLNELQVFTNKIPEAYQQKNAPLKAKKGIFGTKYIEEEPKEK